MGDILTLFPGSLWKGAGAGAKKELSREATAIESVIQLFLKKLLWPGGEGHGKQEQISDGNKIPCPHSFEREEELT